VPDMSARYGRHESDHHCRVPREILAAPPLLPACPKLPSEPHVHRIKGAATSGVRRRRVGSIHRIKTVSRCANISISRCIAHPHRHQQGPVHFLPFPPSAADLCCV
jgi:hypothetical protein